MHSIQFSSYQPISYFQEWLFPNLLDKRIALIACVILCGLAIAFLAVRQGWIHSFKKEDDASTPVIPAKNKADPEVEEEELSQEEETIEDAPPPVVETKEEKIEETKKEIKKPAEDPHLVLLDSQGAEKFLQTINTDELKEVVQKWQKEDKTILKLSELFKSALVPVNGNPMADEIFNKLTDSLENSDLQKLLDKGGNELKMFCCAPLILQILKSNDSTQEKDKKLDQMFNRYQDISGKVFDIMPYVKDDHNHREFLQYSERMKHWTINFSFYLAERCPTSEIETLGKAHSRYGYSNTMRQRLGSCLALQSLLSKDLARIERAIAVYWNHREIFDFGVQTPDAFREILIENIESEEVLTAVYSTITKDKDEMKEVLKKITKLPKDVLDRVLV